MASQARVGWLVSTANRTAHTYQFSRPDRRTSLPQCCTQASAKQQPRRRCPSEPSGETFLNQPAEAKVGQRPHAAHVSLSEAKFIAYMGALGGIIGWIFGLVTGNRPSIPGADHALSTGWHLAATVPAWVLLGAAAALIFTVLVANTDRTDRARVIAISVLSGMFWMPVLNGASELIKKQQEDQLAGEAKQLIQDAAQIAENAKSVQGEQRERALLDASRKLEEANSLAQRTDSARLADSLEQARTTIAGLTEPPSSTDFTAAQAPQLANLREAIRASREASARASAQPGADDLAPGEDIVMDAASAGDGPTDGSEASDTEGE